MKYYSDTCNLEYEMPEEDSINYTANRDVNTLEYLLDKDTYNGTEGLLLESVLTEEVVYSIEGGVK